MGGSGEGGDISGPYLKQSVRIGSSDFRFKPEMLSHFKDEKIDSLFLDNTFACPDQNFPTQ